ncbi:MAG: helix-turn-helix domain-containing protein [Candidatus Methylopumilus sp.]
MSNDSIIIHGHLLKEAREDLNLSIDDVAYRLTLSNKHIISMEENKKDGFVSFQIKLISIRKYAAFLELDIDTIIENTKNKTKSLNLPEPELENKINETDELPKKKILFLIKIKSFFVWAKTYIKVPHIFYFIIFLFVSNFVIGVYQKYAVAHKNFEGKEVELLNFDSLPNDIATYEIKPLEEKQLSRKAVPIEVKNLEENNKDLDIKMCGQAISKPITQVSSPTDPLKPSDYFHIISKGQQTICILDAEGTENKYSLTEGQKLTYRGGKAPFKLLIDPAISEIFYEGWLVKLKAEQSYIQLNPKTYN